MSETTISFPRLSARTGRFSYGAPTSFAISTDGDSVLYLQSGGPYDPVKRLLQFRVGNQQDLPAAHDPRVLVDPAQLSTTSTDLPAAELARRERMREAGSGIVSSASMTHTTTPASRL